MNEEVKESIIINEEEYKSQMDRDMYYNLKCGSVGDTADEFIKSREFLSQGDLIFEYKNSEKRDVKNNVLGLTIRIHNQFTETEPFDLDEFIVELITEEYSVIYPHVPRTYLDVELYNLLKDSKVPNDVLITYKQIIEDLKV